MIHSTWVGCGYPGRNDPGVPPWDDLPGRDLARRAARACAGDAVHFTVGEALRRRAAPQGLLQGDADWPAEPVRRRAPAPVRALQAADRDARAALRLHERADRGDQLPVADVC